MVAEMDTAAGSRSATALPGLYIHVPFCRSRCIYCDFYSTTGRDALRDGFVAALCKEMVARREEVAGSVDTVYLGGGTPSTLQPAALERVFDTLHHCYEVSPGAEVTVEANPDDVTPDFCRLLVALGINRVSLGVQTFNDEALRFLRRRHSADDARRAVRRLADTGIDNLTIDLIYGLPGETAAMWGDDVAAALSLPVKHLSAYALMYEDGTPLTTLRDRGEVAEVDEELSVAQFEHLIATTEEAGMQHYEISNFAYPGYRSRHNCKYWKGVPYLGFGPGAHSYDGVAGRRFNAPDLAAYVAQPGRPPFEMERLTAIERCEERIFTALRTCEGLELSVLERDFGTELATQVRRAAKPYLDNGLLQEVAGRLVLTRRGIFLSNRVMSDLMPVE